MIRCTLLAVWGLLIPELIFAQYTYTWDQENISAESSVEMEVYKTEYSMMLEGGGIKADIGTLEGMGNSSELAGSLDNFASSFGYEAGGKAKSVKTTANIYAAWLDVTKDGKNAILFMFATKNLKKHYFCEISFPENKRSAAEALVKSISCGSSGKTVTVKEDTGDGETKDGIEGGQSGQAALAKGVEAPDFTLKDVNGKNVSLSAFRGKTILLDFWGTWCAPCVENIPSLKAFYEKNGGEDFEIISVANDPNTAKWKKMIAEKGMNWTHVIDPEGTVCGLYNIKYYPTMILINSKGKIVDLNAFEDKAGDYLAGIRGNLKGNTIVTVTDDGDSGSTGLAAGLTAPHFIAADMNGQTVSPSAFKGKTLLLDFWGTWCGACIQLIPSLKTIYDTYGGPDFEILGIANDTDRDKWKKMIADKGMNWTHVIDPEGKVAILYNVKSYPTMMIIDKAGKIVSLKADEDEVAEYLKNAGSSSGKSNTGSGRTGKVTTGVSTGDNNIKTNKNSGSGGSAKKTTGKITNTHTSGSAAEKTTWRLLSAYSADGYTILDETVTAPTSFGGASVSGNDDFTQWIDGNSERDIVKSINTVVHEMCHGYAGKLYIKALMDQGLTPDGTYTSYYLGNGEMKLVKHTDGFTTDKINSIFPKKLITSRYDTYVFPSSASMGSQQHGVYGLLDELHAYYAGTKAAYDFFQYYQEKDNSAEGWSEYVTGYYVTFYAYLEFKSYILYYMLYAKQNQPGVYNDILANEDYLYALRKTDENWTNLINDFKKTRATLYEDLKSKGIEVREEGEFTYFGSKGTGNFSDTYNTFLEGLKDKKIQDIAKAMGLTSAGGPDF